jgi:hypothetical protein
MATVVRELLNNNNNDNNNNNNNYKFAVRSQVCICRRLLGKNLPMLDVWPMVCRWSVTDHDNYGQLVDIGRHGECVKAARMFMHMLDQW